MRTIIPFADSCGEVQTLLCRQVQRESDPGSMQISESLFILY